MRIDIFDLNQFNLVWNLMLKIDVAISMRDNMLAGAKELKKLHMIETKMLKIAGMQWI